MSSLMRPASPRGPGRRSLTQVERDLKYNYVPQAEEDLLKERRKVQPLQLVFDILSTGQYMTANAAQDFYTAIKERRDPGYATKQALIGAMEGLTWKRKGDWENVLFGNVDDDDTKEAESQFQGMFPDSEIPTWAKRSIGFLANVVLDPTTYIGVGAAKGALATADDFVMDAAVIALKRFGDLGEMQKLGKVGKEFSEATFKEIGKKSSAKAGAYFRKHAGAEVAQKMDDVLRQAKKVALATPAAELRKIHGTAIDEIIKRAKGPIEPGMAGAAADLLPGSSMPGGLEGLSRIVEELKRTGPTGELVKYGGGGTRAWRFMGRDVPGTVGVRRANWAARTMQTAKDQLGKLRVPGKHRTLADAWWAMNNTGKLGLIRENLGIRNPYQKIVRMLELQSQGEAKVVASRMATRFWREVSEFDDDTVRAAVLGQTAAEEAGKGVSAYDLLDKARELSRGMLTFPSGEALKTNLDDVRKVIQSIDAYNKEMYREALVWVNEGIFGSMREIESYLGTLFQEGAFKAGKAAGPFKPGVTKARKYTRWETTEQEVAKWGWAFGISEETARDAVQKQNLSRYSVDLREIMVGRMMAHGKMAERANMIRQFRELGIPRDAFKQLAEEGDTAAAKFLGQAGSRGGAEIEMLGLTRIDDKALEGYWFDKETAKVLERAVGATGGEGVKGLKKAFDAYTNWWKGIVTMSSGFIARNFFSNNATGLMKHGPEWFNLQKWGAPSSVATIYGIAKENPQALIQKLGQKEGWALRKLDSMVPGTDVAWREAGAEGLRRGIITETTMGRDAPEMLETLAGRRGVNLNPLSPKFTPVQMSHGLNGIVESQSRFQSFAMDFAEVYKQTGDKVSAFDWAEKEAKKWFIDYTDLTEFEREGLRRVVPFYTWIRHNVANQVSAIALYPEMYSLFPKIEEAVSYENPEYDPDLVPEWMKQWGLLPVGKTAEGKIKMWRPDFAYRDLNLIPLSAQEGQPMSLRPDWSEFMQDIAAAAHPAIKAAVELTTGKDLFYRSDLGDTRRAPYLLQFFAEEPERLNKIDGLLRLAGLEDGIMAETDERTGRLRINAKMAKTLEQFLPLLQRMDDVAVAVNMIPGVEDWLEKHAGGIRDPYEGTEQLFQFLAKWTGVKYKELDLEEAKDKYEQEVQRMAEAARRKDLRASPGAKIRRQRYATGRQARARRIMGR